MAKDFDKQPYDEASLTKLDIFEQYLAGWLPIYIKDTNTKRVMIWDFFAGSGQNARGAAGSPLRILRTLEKYRELIFANNIAIDIVLNETSQKKHQELEQSVNELFDATSWNNKVCVSMRNEEFHALFRREYAQIKQQPNLLFINPWGAKELAGDIFQMLIGLDKTDFLFFISASAMKRFARRPEFPTYFPNIDPAIVADAKHQELHRIVLNYYKAKIPTSNETRLYPFTLKKESHIYGLIFGSKNPLGVEKFLDVAWDKKGSDGEVNFDINQDLEKQQRALSSRTKQLSKRVVFEKRLEAYINECGELTNRDVYYFTLGHGHPRVHARELIARLKRDRKVECGGNTGFSYKNCARRGSRPKPITARPQG